jgi:amino acid adenylation domain-containing protein
MPLPDEGLLALSAGPQIPIPETDVGALFLAHAARAPEALAVESPHASLTYGELAASARDIAAFLAARGVEREERVAVLFPPSAALIQAELGIVLAGAAFVPIDPATPADRIRSLLEDLQPRFILAAPESAGRVPAGLCEVVSLRGIPAAPQFRPPALSPANLVYGIYTSGSTGRPKAVLLEHRGLVNLVRHLQRDFAIVPSDRATFLSGVAFDASVLDVWPYLTAGASVHIPPVEARIDPLRLLQWLAAAGITISFITTAMVEQLLERDWSGVPSLRLLITGGDRLQRPPRRRLPFRFVNAYGPTEATVATTTCDVDPDLDQPPPIGRPIANAQAWVLDERMQPVPPGTPGTLFIAGHGLARGYLRRPDLDAKAFAANPFGPGRLYDSGDLVRWNARGELEFIGRRDTQVKIRGFRIELGEIEFQLRSVAGVEQAVVKVWDGPESRTLVAYLVARPGSEDLAARCDAALHAALPAYMVPRHFILLDALPLTPNGKWDMAALPAPAVESEAAVTYAGDAERQVAAIWAEVLGRRRIGPDENLFDLGVDSISLIRIAARLEKLAGRPLAVNELLKASTVRKMAARLAAPPEDAALPESVIPLREGGARPPLFCIAGAGGGVHWFHDFVYAVSWNRPIFGLESSVLPKPGSGPFSVESAAAAFIEDMRRIQPRGPYRLCGFSLGGLIALEMARQLGAAGESVAWLGLIAAFGRIEYRGRFGKVWVYLRNFLKMSPSRQLAFIREKIDWLAARRRQPVAGPAAESAPDAARKIDQIAAGYDYLRRDLPLYPGAATVFCCDRPIATAPTDRWFGWRGRIGHIEIVNVPGSHYTVLAPPHVARLASEGLAALERAEATAAPVSTATPIPISPPAG